MLSTNLNELEKLRQLNWLFELLSNPEKFMDMLGRTNKLVEELKESNGIHSTLEKAKKHLSESEVAKAEAKEILNNANASASEIESRAKKLLADAKAEHDRIALACAQKNKESEEKEEAAKQKMEASVVEASRLEALKNSLEDREQELHTGEKDLAEKIRKLRQATSSV
jgi:hypothetical protein